LKTVYISASEYPQTTANGVQVVKQCNAFSKVLGDVVLLARVSKKNIDRVSGIRQSYQIADKVELKMMRYCFLPSVLRSIIYPIWVCSRISRGTEFVYSRHMLALLFVGIIFRTKKTLLECHAPPCGYLKVVFWILWKMNLLCGLVVISRKLKEILLAQYNGLDPTKILVAHDGCDPESVLSVNFKATSVGYVGGFYKGRGLALIVRLAERMIDVNFHLIGGTISELSSLTNMKVPANLVCHGRVSQAELPRFYGMFNVAIAPYESVVYTPDGSDTSSYMSPLKIFEYMAWQKVVLASDLPVIREVLIDHVNSFLLPPDDINAWEDAINRLKDIGLAKKLIDNAYQDAVLKYSWEVRARSIIFQYEVES
jgi:glycosyltransferase involved in cell wall biosynthesis